VVGLSGKGFCAFGLPGPMPGKWQILFYRKKYPKTVGCALCYKGSAFTLFICTAKAKADFGVQLGFCFYALW
jgi:hypothetical protein